MDLGLPSGTLWATCNVGASKPSDYGQYFQWGDAQGYTKDQVGTGDGKKEFDINWSDYKWYKSGSDGEFTKYTAGDDKLELEDDAAHVNMGGDWHMPTIEQCEELINSANTTTAWTTSDGVSGITITSKKDTSKSIFIPAAGEALDGSVRYSESSGYVWDSTNEGRQDYGVGLAFWSSSPTLAAIFDDFRSTGCSVRGVIG